MQDLYTFERWQARFFFHYLENILQTSLCCKDKDNLVLYQAAEIEKRKYFLFCDFADAEAVFVWQVLRPHNEELCKKR